MDLPSFGKLGSFQGTGDQESAVSFSRLLLPRVRICRRQFGRAAPLSLSLSKGKDSRSLSLPLYCLTKEREKTSTTAAAAVAVSLAVLSRSFCYSVVVGGRVVLVLFGR